MHTEPSKYAIINVAKGSNPSILISHRPGCTMDHIVIRDLELSARIGVHAFERRLQQTLRLQLKLGCDAATVAKNDDLRQALDYQAVVDFIKDFIAGSTCALIETLADGLASALLQRFSLPGLELELCKPNIMPGTTEVGIVLRRGQPL